MIIRWMGIFIGTLSYTSLLHAHNCGSLDDCFGTIQAATGVGVGIAVMMVMGAFFQLFQNKDFEMVVAGSNSITVKLEGDDLISHPRVRSEMERALKDSGDFVRLEKDVREQGGWIIGRGGHLSIQRVSPGTSSSLRFPLPPPPDAVGAFHTHPYGHDVSVNHKPSSADVDFTNLTKLPHFIIDRQGIIRVHPGGGFHDVVVR